MAVSRTFAGIVYLAFESKEARCDRTFFIDTFVMDNDEAEKRHGVQQTYKSETWENHKLDVLWKRSGAPPRFVRAQN